MRFRLFRVRPASRHGAISPSGEVGERSKAAILKMFQPFPEPSLIYRHVSQLAAERDQLIRKLSVALPRR
jgi:hypothetical protein